MNKYIATIILGILVGIIGGIQGIAGSIYILVGLLVMGIVTSQKDAAGTTLIVTALPISLLAAYNYYKKGDAQVDVAVLLSITIFISMYFGAKLNYMIPKRYIYLFTGATVFLSSLYFFYRGYMLLQRKDE